MFSSDKTPCEAQGTEDRAEKARVTAGQRDINRVWEYTQASIALILVLATVASALHVSFYSHPGDKVPDILLVLVGTVVGSYFQRTNHMNIGGAGAKPTDLDKYVGR